MEDDGNDAGTRAYNQVTKLYNAMNRQRAATDHNVTDFEKNLGLILKKFNETEDAVEDPIEDAQYFEEGLKTQFSDFKKNFRGVVDNLRDKDYNIFVKVNEGKAKANDEAGIYTKLNEDLQKLQAQINKTNDAKNLINGLFSGIKQEKQVKAAQL